jgi:membrane fusion protein, multidrug efflux system
MRMFKKTRLLFIFSILTLSAGCKRKPPMMGPMEVSVVTLRAQPLTLTTELPGRVTAHRIADVRPQASGVILKRLFNEGTDVQAGQSLYQIDPAFYRAAYESAQATVEKDSASLVSAAALLNRYRPLVQANAVSKQDLDNALSAQLGAAADLAAGRAAMQTARINLVYTNVLAPISGRISRSAVTEGALVTANQVQALATIQQLDPIYVDVTQPSSLLLRLEHEYADGQLKNAGKNQALVHLTLEDGTIYDIPGKLQFSEVTVDPGTGAVTLRAVFPNPHHTLLPGMFVQEQIQEGVDEDALLVPQRGITHNQRGEPTALVIGKDNKVEARTLTTDRAIGDMWLVTDGLNPGDRLIVEGLQKIGPGAPVQGVEVPATSTATPTGQ